MSDQSVLLSQLVVLAAQAGAAVLAARVALVIGLTLLARALGHRRSGRRLATWAIALSPRFARRALATALGTGVVLGLTCSGATAAESAPAPPGSLAPASSVGALLDRGTTSVAATPSLPRETRGTVRPRRAAEPPRPHTVRPGDSLWSIAADALGPDASTHDVARAWPRWHAANRDVIGPDPGVLRPGDRLVPPPRRSSAPHADADPNAGPGHGTAPSKEQQP